jgi:hypothetical protein
VPFPLARTAAYLREDINAQVPDFKALVSQGLTYMVVVDKFSHDAGWSSQVARWAHNPKVGGSNPLPATSDFERLRLTCRNLFCFGVHPGVRAPNVANRGRGNQFRAKGMKQWSCQKQEKYVIRRLGVRQPSKFQGLESSGGS